MRRPFHALLFLFAAPLAAQTAIEEAKLLASNGADNDGFGRFVALDGDRAIAGIWDNGQAGGAYVFERTPTGWVEDGELLPSPADDGPLFVFSSVALSGDFALLGSDLFHVDPGDLPGSVLVFERSSGSWTKAAKLEASDGAAHHRFGNAVDVSGAFAVVGAYRDDAQGLVAGSAYVFQRTATRWIEHTKLAASDGAQSAAFGGAVAIDGDFAIVGASGHDGLGIDSGAAYVFERVGGGWTQAAKLVASDGAALQRFGTSVAVSGDRALVGAPGPSGAPRGAGSAYVYERTMGGWVEQAKLTVPAATGFGQSVSLSSEFALVGAAGEAFLYEWEVPGRWSQTKNLVAAGGAETFGPVAVSDDFSLVGASSDDQLGSDAGAAYVFGNGALPSGPGAFGIGGSYASGMLTAETASACGASAVRSGLGMLTLLPDGSFASTGDGHEVCESGAVTDAPFSDSGTYVVADDGRLNFDPGTPQAWHAFLRPDLAVLLSGGDSANQQPNLQMAVRLGQGRTEAALSGAYHVARCMLGNDGSGTYGEAWSGTMAFDGVGGFTGNCATKTVAADGTTTLGATNVAGTYSVASDGSLEILGLPGATLWGGAAAEDGAFFFAVDGDGQDVGIVVGVPVSGAANAESLSGRWGMGALSAELGSEAWLPSFCSEGFDLEGHPATSELSGTGKSLCEDPFWKGVESDDVEAAYAVAPDGALLVGDASEPMGLWLTGGVDPDGTLGFLVDMVEEGEVSLLALARRGTLPVAYGVPTPGTGGAAPQIGSAGGFAYLGNVDFALVVDQALPTASLLCLTLLPSAGLPVAGGLLWVDLATLILAKPALVSPTGEVVFSLPVPSGSALDGVPVYAQAIVLDPGAAGGYSMTSGLEITIYR